MSPLSFNRIKETCLYVKDLDASEAFYHGKIGLPIISKVAGRHLFLQAGDSVLLCFIAEITRREKRLAPHFGEGQLHFAFETSVEQYPLWKAKIQEQGIEIEKEVEWDPGVYSFYFRDPDQHCVEIIMPAVWS